MLQQSTYDKPKQQEVKHVEVIYEEPPKVQKETKKVEIKERDYIQELQLLNPIEIKDENKSIKNIHISDLADIYDLQLKEETITLYKSSDKSNRYDISIKSSQKITSVLPEGRYILLSGTLEEYGKESKFSLSFNEHYKEFTEYSYIEVSNKELNTIASCDGSFLSGITSEYKYSLKLDLSGDMLSCYIKSEDKSIETNNILDIKRIIQEKSNKKNQI